MCSRASTSSRWGADPPRGARRHGARAARDPALQRRVVPRSGHTLVLTVPAGWRASSALAEADAAGELGPEAYARASEEYGISWVG